MEVLKKLIIDGETLLNHWVGLEDLTDTELYLSAGNFLLAKSLLAKSLEFLDKFEDKKIEYLEAHANIISFLNNEAITRAFISFVDSDEPFMETISLCDPSQNLRIIVFKGVQLKKAPGDKIDPIIDETVALAEYWKQKGDRTPIYTMNINLLEFIREFEFDLDLIDGTID